MRQAGAKLALGGPSTSDSDEQGVASPHLQAREAVAHLLSLQQHGLARALAQMPLPRMGGCPALRLLGPASKGTGERSALCLLGCVHWELEVWHDRPAPLLGAFAAALSLHHQERQNECREQALGGVAPGVACGHPSSLWRDGRQMSSLLDFSTCLSLEIV